MDIKDIKRVDIPFTLYDFFGYLLPGLTFGALSFLSFDLPKMFGYTSDMLLGTKPTTPSLLLFAIIKLFDKSPFFISVLAIVISYVLGHIISSLSSLLFERFIVRGLISYPADNMFQLRRRTHPFFRNYRRSYTEEFIQRFRQEFESQFRISLSDAHDVFWITFEFVAHNTPSVFARSMYFLNLYGFSRNLSMAFLASAVFLLSYEVTHSLTISWLLIGIYTVIAFTLFWNYLKLLRRLNDEVFRGFYAFVSTSIPRTSTQGRRKQK